MLLNKKEQKNIGALFCIAIGVAILAWMMLPKNARTEPNSLPPANTETVAKDNPQKSQPKTKKTSSAKPKAEQKGKKKSSKLENLEIPRYTVEREGWRVVHTGYTVDFNADWHIPNWVAYELTAEELNGEEERSNKFRPDPALIDICPDTREYSHSGYDRGHMAPAGDMKWSKQAMEESFYMSNICPQLHNLNSGDWQTLEDKVRQWAGKFGSAYVVCGPIVEPGYQTIGTMKVAVPAAFYKVVLCQNNGKWQAIGFVFKHEDGRKKFITYCKTVDEVEQITGIDFFYLLDDKIENEIEASFTASDWNLKN